MEPAGDAGAHGCACTDACSRAVAVACGGGACRFVGCTRCVGEARRVREARRFRETCCAGDLWVRQGNVMMNIRSLALAVVLVAGCRESTPAPSAATSAAPVASTAAPAAPTPSPSAAATPALLKEGDPAPALTATAANGAAVDLAAMKGKHVVVYFYPKDDTPGCTKEACAFRDAWSKLEKGKVQVLGVSVDDNESHKKFAEKYKLPFPLIADPDQKICKSFGVPVNSGYASRVSFLIGPDGKIKKVYPKVDPGVHADEILTDAGVTS